MSSDKIKSNSSLCNKAADDIKKKINFDAPLKEITYSV
jgi:hypothetical protein